MIERAKSSSNLNALLAKPGAGKAVLTCRPGKLVFEQGDRPDSVFYILQGKIKLAVLSENGKEGVIAVLEAGDFFGHLCLCGQMQRLSTASALTSCTLVRVEIASAFRMIEDHPAFASALLSFLLHRSVKMEQDLVDQLFNSSEKRLARALLSLANFGDDGRSASVIPWISQATLAEMIGTTRSRVNAFMNGFRRAGYIDYDDDICIRRELVDVLLRR